MQFNTAGLLVQTYLPLLPDGTTNKSEGFDESEGKGVLLAR